ncbi:MAG TPA: hypothetical protein VG222_01915 [Vicinamibacterales bacterium]|nr:hypothetical protein [Vicinamibacterales bacterium]
MKTVNHREPAASRATAFAFYAVMVLVTAAVFRWIRSIGNQVVRRHPWMESERVSA